MTGGRELVLEREPPPFVVSDPRIAVRLSHRRAAIGEAVEAELRLPGAVGPHRIEVRPGRPGVRILGPRAFDVDGLQPVTVRFTCWTAGRRGYCRGGAGTDAGGSEAVGVLELERALVGLRV